MGQGGRGLCSCCSDRPYCQVLKTKEHELAAGDHPSFWHMAERCPSSSDASTLGSGGYIEHNVSKLDTLAGVAIKYGVEVADVKRLNGLTTDLQIYALKTLRIPLPGRHPPSSGLTSPVRSRCESSTSRPGAHLLGSNDSCPHSGIKHRAMEKRPLTSAMGLLRGHYGLASASSIEGEGTEMATYKFDNKNYSHEDPFLATNHPRETIDRRRFSTGDRRTIAFDSTRESSNLLDTCWSVQTPAAPSRDSTLLIKSGRDHLEIVDKFGGIHSDEGRPIRRRAKGEFGSDDKPFVSERVNVSVRNPISVSKELTSSLLNNCPAPRNGWHNSDEDATANGLRTIGAALLGGKEAVEDLISKVRQSTNATSLQGVKPSSGLLSIPTGTSSVLEGITSAYRRAKSALD